MTHDTAEFLKIHIPWYEEVSKVIRVQVTLFKKYEATNITSTLVYLIIFKVDSFKFSFVPPMFMCFHLSMVLIYGINHAVDWEMT